jgi:hypothetical protein
MDLYLITGLLGFAFLVLFFASALHGAELHSKGLKVRENPLQKLLWKIAGKWTGYLFTIFIVECLLLAIGGGITNWLKAFPGALYFGGLLALTLLWWPKEAKA